MFTQTNQIMSSKSLNPNAQEFKPINPPKKLHPQLIFSNSTQTTEPFTVTQPPLMTYNYPIFHWVSTTTTTQTPYHNQYSPDKVFPAVEECKGSGKTTVMIKNVPNQLRRDFMLNCMDNCCRNYSLEYDFFYLPMDFRSGQNLGYAFVNFTSEAAANTFMSVFDGFNWVAVHTDEGLINTKKICRITWARVQGKEGLLRRFQWSNFICDNLEYLPVLLDPPRNGLNANPLPPVIIGQLRPCSH